MSLRHEQALALQRTLRLLMDILGTEHHPRTKRELRARAHACLRHFPPLDKNGEPIFSQDSIGRAVSPQRPQRGRLVTSPPTNARP